MGGGLLMFFLVAVFCHVNRRRPSNIDASEAFARDVETFIERKKIIALVFRNAAFVVTTILLGFSLAVRKPYDVELGLVSIAFSTLVLLSYNYYLRFSVDREGRAESTAS